MANGIDRRYTGIPMIPQVVEEETSIWDTIAPLAQMISGGLSSDNIPQEPYYGMGRKPDMLTPQIYNNGDPTGIYVHPGVGDGLIKKRKPNIWT